jgi:methionine aminotransferase
LFKRGFLLYFVTPMPIFQNQVKSKLPQVGTTIFATMSALATKHQAINLAQGFPDFMCSEKLISLVNKAMLEGHNQYAPMPGLMSLREKIAEKTEYLYAAKYNPETEITVVPGGTIALYAAITATIKENDEVIIIEPCYDSYLPAIELNGGKAVFTCYKLPDYKIDWNEIKKLINSKTKMIIINTPNNPTGSIFSAADMQKLDKLINGSNIIVLSDEVYEHIIFDGIEHQSVARFPNLAERSFIVSSFGKTFHTTGWKMGYCLAPANLMAEFRKVYQFMAFSAHTPTQYALAAYLENKEEYLTLSAFYQEKRDYFKKLLEGSRFKLTNCLGSYFQCAFYDKISDEGDKVFCNRLTEEHGVAAIPVSAFYAKGDDHKVIRFCFAKKNETLEKAAEKLIKL